MGVCEIAFKTDRKSTNPALTKFIPIHKVVWKLDEEQTNILLRSYALTVVTRVVHVFIWALWGRKKAFK